MKSSYMMKTTQIDSPWGETQNIEHLAPGVLLVTTASHGGLRLDDGAVKTLPANIQTAGTRFGIWRCFEEDEACGLVYEARIDLYRERKRLQLSHCQNHVMAYSPSPWTIREGAACIDRLHSEVALSDEDLIAPVAASNRRWYPEIYGLPPNCVHCCGQHDLLHPGTMISSTAWGSWDKSVPAGFVGVMANVGGHAAVAPEDKKKHYFLVAKDECDARDGSNIRHACSLLPLST